MPLRIAEKDGFIYAVNDCGRCPFNKSEKIKNPPQDCAPLIHMLSNLYCGHGNRNNKEKVEPNSIPVWCPLPEPTMKHTLEHK